MAARVSVISILLPLLWLCHSASAQTTENMTLSIGELNEVVRKGALISGAVVVGVQARQVSSDSPTLTGYLPSLWAGHTVCAKVVSADGLYEAVGPYSVPGDWAGGSADFPFPTKHGELLRSMPEDGIGVLVSDGECEAQDGAVKSVALWNADRADTVDIILNSFRADSVFTYVGNQTAPVQCSRIASGGGTAFDAKCNLPTAGLSGQTTIEIYRVVGGKPSKPTALEVWFPEDPE